MWGVEGARTGSHPERVNVDLKGGGALLARATGTGAA